MNVSNEIILSKPEIYILISIMTNHSESGQSVLKSLISENLKSVNSVKNDAFINFTLNLNIENLIKKELIERSSYSNETAYLLTSAGINWLSENEYRLQKLLTNKELDKNLIES